MTAMEIYDFWTKAGDLSHIDSELARQMRLEAALQAEDLGQCEFDHENILGRDAAPDMFKNEPALLSKWFDGYLIAAYTYAEKVGFEAFREGKEKPFSFSENTALSQGFDAGFKDAIIDREIFEQLEL